MIKVLRLYARREGHTNVPLSHEEGRVRLGAWLSKQWSEHQAGRLSSARTLALEAAGVVWDGPAPPASGAVGPRYLNERKWDVSLEFDRVTKLAAQRGHTRPFDAAPLAAYEPDWRPYDAEHDPHARASRHRRRSNAPPPDERESTQPAPFPLWGAPRVRGLPAALGARLHAECTELAAERAQQRTGSA